MRRYGIILLLTRVLYATALNLDYLDPIKLQTKTSASVQQDAATRIIERYSNQVIVEVNPLLFSDNKDVFALRTTNRQLHIRASSGVAAVWGFHYYLKKYCNSHVGWQVKRIVIPNPLPDVDEAVVANDRFRFYQNVCTVSYSFVWWNQQQWIDHIEWMAMNGINMALAPVAQEAAWAKIYKQIGMTNDEIDEHFTGPAFLSWFRMGNIRGWGGPLLKSWHDRQKSIQDTVVDQMFNLGMIPVFPTFSGHVPKAFSRIFPNSTFYAVDEWNKFSPDYCCGLFLDPNDSLFKTLGKAFLNEITTGHAISSIFSGDPFNEIKIQPWSTALVVDTAKAIFSTISQFDQNAVWMLQNWMLVHDPVLWPLKRVKSFITSVPSGRLLILDLQSEQWPQYDLYDMYYGQPFVWCMLHNFGGTLGMFGNMKTINHDVHKTRYKAGSTMIGVGLTPEGINQNYVVYDLMLESAWRKSPVADLNVWVEQYAARRYGCNITGSAWRHLLQSVYNFDGPNRMRGKYAVTRRPSFRFRTWAWYESKDLFEAFKSFAFVSNQCDSPGFYHDLVDVTRQALQYRGDQLYRNLVINRFSSSWVFNASIIQFLDVMNDMEQILASNNDFTITSWLNGARSLAVNASETYLYELNARNQITLWGPNGEISDYACKQWAEVFHYYYTPRWSMFLSAALDMKLKNEVFDEKATQNIIRRMVENKFSTVRIDSLPQYDATSLALSLYKKWANVPDLSDLPLSATKTKHPKMTTLAITASTEDDTNETPSVVLLHSSTPTQY